jgi:hypothetical protein
VNICGTTVDAAKATSPAKRRTVTPTNARVCSVLRGMRELAGELVARTRRLSGSSSVSVPVMQSVPEDRSAFP